MIIMLKSDVLVACGEQDSRSLLVFLIFYSSLSYHMGTCPFRASYENLKKLGILATNFGVPESVKHAAHANRYPWLEGSRKLNMTMRKELKETFLWVDEYMDEVLNTNSVDELLGEYDELVEKYQLDTQLLIVPEEKWYDQVRKKLMNEFSHNPVVRSLLEAYVVYSKQNKELSCKALVTQMMKQMSSKLDQGMNFAEIIGDLPWMTDDQVIAETLDEETKEGLVLFSSLQERHYLAQEIREWNESLWINKEWTKLIKLTHVLLHKYIQRYCEHNTERYRHSFQILQEISTHTKHKWIVPNQRFMKIIANNIGPGLMRYKDLDFQQSMNKIRKQLRIYDQRIFGFIEKDEGIVIDSIEMKACPAQNLVHSSLKKVQPYLIKTEK